MIALLLLGFGKGAAHAACVQITSPANRAIVEGTVAVQTVDICKGAWFEVLKIDGINAGAFSPGTAVFNSLSLTNGLHKITIKSQSINPNSVVLGTSSIEVNVQNGAPTPSPTSTPIVSATPTPSTPTPTPATPTPTPDPPTPTPATPTPTPATPTPSTPTPTPTPCITVKTPANNATVSGTSVAITTTDTCSGVWFENLLVDGVASGSYAPGQVVFNSTQVSNGTHQITVTSQSINPGSVELGSASVMLNVENGGAGGSSTPTPTATATPGPHYSMLPPGATLPSESTCTTQVNAAPLPENAPWNQNDGTGYNSNQPPPGGIPSYFYQYAPCCTELPNSDFAAVDGAYSGSTDDIFRVYACKWGIDEDYIRAQALIESHWHQDCAAAHGGSGCTEGGDENNPAGCTTGLPVTPITPNGMFCAMEGFGGLASPNQYDSWSIVQSKVYYEWMTWPMMEESTPFGVDYRYAEMRGCVNGDQYSYFNSQSSSSGTDYQNAVTAAKSNPNGASKISGWTNLQYLAYGCIDTHFSGDWFNGSADSYLSDFLSTLSSADWPGGNR